MTTPCTTAKLITCINPAGFGAALLVPVFAAGDQILIQDVDAARATIIGFSEIELSGLTVNVREADQQMRSVGDEALLAFTLGDGEAVCGTHAEIDASLRALLAQDLPPELRDWVAGRLASLAKLKHRRGEAPQRAAARRKAAAQVRHKSGRTKNAPGLAPSAARVAGAKTFPTVVTTFSAPSTRSAPKVEFQRNSLEIA